uniref:Uncharacterized protein n=1 Tax=Solanum lycopersicum TaxID=4081 RepID=A0A3Q7IXR7_SOLLC
MGGADQSPINRSIAGSIQYEDWANVRNVTKFLDKFYELTLKVSSSRSKGQDNEKIILLACDT